MKYQTTLMMLAALLLLGTGTMAKAVPGNETIGETGDEQLRAQLEAEYEKAMSAAELQQVTAGASLQKAREQLELAAKQKASAQSQSAEARSAREAEMAKMHEELNNARRQLQETSREIARVNREVARARADRHAANIVARYSERPVIGVILGAADSKGVEILGVSPDGPSERAGIRKADRIVALNGRELSAIEDSGNPREGLRIALRDIKVDEPLVVSVDREGQMLDLTVVPEVREPLAWQTITRFPTAPAAPAAPGTPEKVITIEHIVVPEIDTEAMAAQIEQMRTEIEKRRAVHEASRVAPVDGDWEIEIDEMSELGNLALQDAEIWFGLPLAQGLQLAEVDPGLGEYFKTDRGVLVLKAREDNDLQLKPGDVILQVGDTEVNTPAEFMRALRSFDSGDEFVMDIKRNKKNHTLKTIMPEARSSYFLPKESEIHTFTITSSTD
jgi:S1-C subfamily serine protease